MGPIVFITLIAMQASIAPARMPAQGAVAAGAGWVLEQAGPMLRLVDQGRLAIATITGRRQTPWGTVIDARSADAGVVKLTIVFAACRVGGRHGSHMVQLSWDGRSLTGCYLRPPPLEKPLLD